MSYLALDTQDTYWWLSSSAFR